MLQWSWFYPKCLMMLAVGVAGCALQGADDHDRSDTTTVGSDRVAWWLEQEFAPKQQQLHGIHLSEFDPSWRRATVLDSSVLREKLNAKQYQEFKRSEQKLEIKADLNGNAEPEQFWVGVYGDDAGATGRFLAVVENGLVQQVFQHPGPTTYSGLMYRDESLRWYKCMICDDFDIVEWQDGDYELNYREYSPVPEV